MNDLLKKWKEYINYLEEMDIDNFSDSIELYKDFEHFMEWVEKGYIIIDQLPFK